MSGSVICKYCGSTNVVKYGTHEGIQRYYCKVCKRKFVPNRALPKMKTPMNVIASALSCYFGGMPLDAVQRHLDQQYGIYLSEAGIYNWIVRFAKEVVNRTRDFKPITGDTWIADEMVIKVGGKNIWFWDVIDAKSRFLLASRLSASRTTKDAALVMSEAKRRAGKTPKRIITDGLAAYIDGIELVFGADTKHVRSKPFVEVDSTNIIERFQGTMKDRTDVVRGFKKMDNAKLITDAWLVHYNFFKEHEALGNVPPAQKMGIPVPFKNWADVLEVVRRDMTKAKTEYRAEATPSLTKAPIKPTVHKHKAKPKHKKSRCTVKVGRKPKGLKQKAHVAATLSTMRLK